MKEGYIQVYTGNGKGKTMACLGLTLRAAGAGFKVYIAQYVKHGNYSEVKTLKRFEDLVSIRQYGRPGRQFEDRAVEEDVRLSRQGLEDARQAMVSLSYDVVILEEVNVAIHLGFLTVEEVLEVVRQKPVGVELIMTGRDADARIIEAVDLVNEMRAIKHYYQQGLQASRGVEF